MAAPELIPQDASRVRLTRDIELKNCDWRVMPDSPLSDSKVAEWKTFRQA